MIQKKKKKSLESFQKTKNVFLGTNRDIESAFVNIYFDKLVCHLIFYSF